MVKADVEATVVSTSVIAKMFGLTDRRVRQLVEEGVLKRVGHGRFNLIDTVNQYVTFLRLQGEEAGEQEVSEALEYEKWLHEKAKREKAEIELAHIKNEMHKSVDVERVMNHMLASFRAKLMSMPSKLALTLVDRESPDFIESVLEKNVHEVLTELANYDPSMFFDDEEEEEGEGDEQ